MNVREIESRRRFLFQAATSVGLVLTAPIIASIVASCEFDETVQGAGQSCTVDISTMPELADVGSITIATVCSVNGGQPVFISRIAVDAFAVFSNVCTHQGCNVELPFAEGEDCVCPCHSSVFSRTTGKVVQQPTSGSATDLPVFPSTYDPATQILTISGTPE